MPTDSSDRYPVVKPTNLGPITADPRLSVSLSQFADLLEDQCFLRALEAAGIDNWDGYDIARDMLRAESETTLPHAYD